jgi:hypothetical protein
MGKAVRVFLGGFLKFLLYYHKLTMLKKQLEELLNSAKNRAICSLNVIRDDVDSIFLGFSDYYDIRFVYNKNSLRGVYYISPDSAIFYTYGNNVDQLPAVKKLKSFVKEQFNPKETGDLRAFDNSSFKELVKEKFIEHGVKNLFLKTLLAGSCDIIGIQTESNNLVFGLQYFERIRIAASIGEGTRMKRYEI